MLLFCRHAVKIQSNQRMRKTPKTSPSLGMWTPSNTPTLLTTPNGTSISSCIFAQICHKHTTDYNGMLQIHPVHYPCHGAIVNLNYLLHPQNQPTHTPNSIKIQSAILHWTDRRTNRPTDGIDDKTCTNNRLYYIYCSNAPNNDNYLHHQQHTVSMYTAHN